MKFIYCWRCLWKSFEFLGFKHYLDRKGKCFYCRMDYLDRKYGPSYLATLYAEANKGVYKPSQRLTRLEVLNLRLKH